MSTTTRDLAQEIDDLSTQQAAVINAIREFSERCREGDYDPHRADILASYILDAFDKATEDLNEVQAEPVAACFCGCDPCCKVAIAEVEQAGRSAFREAGLTNRVDVGEASTPLGPRSDGMLFLAPAEREAYLAWRQSVTGPLRFQSKPLAALMVAITEANS